MEDRWWGEDGLMLLLLQGGCEIVRLIGCVRCICICAAADESGELDRTGADGDTRTRADTD